MKQVTVWMSEDGSTFETERDCQRYESLQTAKTTLTRKMDECCCLDTVTQVAYLVDFLMDNADFFVDVLTKCKK
jgi:hypothetical protein